MLSVSKIKVDFSSLVLQSSDENTYIFDARGPIIHTNDKVRLYLSIMAQKLLIHTIKYLLE